MKKIAPYLLVPCLLMLILSASCREDFDFQPATGNLSFSKDTVFLDTIFTNIGSSTYTLKVYNNSNEDIIIPEVRLVLGNASNYRLNVDGMAGKEFEDVPLLAKDSLFVFVETTFNIGVTGETEFLHTDQIFFGDASTGQTVELVTLVRDAIFLYPRELGDGSLESVVIGQDALGNPLRIEGFILEPEELNFANEKPYVIYGYATVPEGSTLTMEAGTRVHFHENSGILVNSGGTIRVNGSLSEDQELLENEVIFEGDRLEPAFADVPGQWGGLWLAAGSTGHQFTHLSLKNATIGIFVEGESPLEDDTVVLENCRVYNSSITNLWSRNAAVQAANCIFGSAGSASVYCNLGGNYDFKHCTIGNYWTNGLRNTPALVVDNFLTTPQGPMQTADLINARFANCVIEGNRNIELGLLRNEDQQFNFAFESCAVRFVDNAGLFINDPLYDFENPALFQNVLRNPNADFEAPLMNNFVLSPTSELLNIGDPATAAQVPFDIVGVARTQSPDLGAFEFEIPE